MIPAPAPPSARSETGSALASPSGHGRAIAAASPPEDDGSARISVQMLMQIKPIVTPVVTPGKAPA